MNAFARLDVKASYAVVKEDEKVDEEYDAITKQCIASMRDDPDNIKRVMNVTWVAPRVGADRRPCEKYL